MTRDVAFSCECGTITGCLLNVGLRRGDRYVCYCSDCRDLTRHLGCDGKVLDRHGGLDIYQTRCARMRIHSGKDQLAAVHMTDKPLARWYAGCCNTPLFNTLDTGTFPFVTTIVHALDPTTRNAVLGPPRGALFAGEATDQDVEIPSTSMVAVYARFGVRALLDRFSGDYRRTELFDAVTLQPIVPIRRLTETEQRALGRS